MAERLSRLDFGLINKLLLIGCLVVANAQFVLAVSYSRGWEERTALLPRHNAFAQKVLLESLIMGAGQDEALEMVRREALKPENKSLDLEVGPDAVALGEIRIRFKGGKVAAIEY